MKTITLLLLSSVLLLAPPVAAEGPCPESLARQLEGHAPGCRLIEEGTLRSKLGNGDVVFRLYRWVSTLEEPPGPLYDARPYNQVGVTLGLARKPGGGAFWAGHYWLGTAWFEAPYLAANRKYGELLVVPGRYAGTGSFVEDHVFLPTMAAGWTEIDARQLDQETGEGWLAQLQAYLPEGAYIAKGVRLDYGTLSGETSVWRRDDANCCPSGGTIRFRLKIFGPRLSFEVAEASYTP